MQRTVGGDGTVVVPGTIVVLHRHLDVLRQNHDSLTFNGWNLQASHDVAS
jgi:hypothetical protein